MKKKSTITNTIIALALACSLFAALPAGAAYAAEPSVADNIVRVHLNSYGEPSSFSMNAAGSYTITDNGKALSGAFTVAASGSGLRLTNGSAAYDLDGDIYIKAGSLAVGNLIQINGSYGYVGDMRILNKSGKLKLINHVDIETYVMGVLPFEMGNGWPAEALKSQAVAARSYAYYVMNSRSRTTVEQDLVNSISHQVYYGYNSSYANCIAAVNATKNMILKTYAGQTVYACFSASNGGMTESGVASGAAAANYDYLPAKEDPYDLAYALATTVYSGKVQVPKTLGAGDLKGSAAQPYKMIREKLQAAGVDINAIAQDAAVNSIALTNPKAQSPSRQFTGADFAVSLPGIGDYTLSFGPTAIPGSGSYPFLNSILGLGTKFTMLALRDDGAYWTLASVRYGHGAGLSQVGAYQMAAQGKTYQEILTFYYNLGTAANLVTMPWDSSGGGTDPGAPGYTVTEVAKTGTVNTGSLVLNVRSGPATGNAVVTTLKNGSKVTITGQVSDWWRIDLGSGNSGFVSGAYIKLDADQPSAPPAAPATQAGTVNAPGTTLNVRSGAGMSYAIIGSLKHGDKVTIESESGSWYKLTYSGKAAYASKAYVKLDSASGSTPAAPSTPTVKTGYVNTPGMSLNVRSGAGTAYAVIGSLKHGSTVTIESESGSWYKLTYSGKTAYVSKAYISDTAPSATPAAPAAKTGTVNAAAGLNVRSGAGTNYKIIGGLKHGSTVTIASQSGSWYKIKYGVADGWVSASFVK
ncbi:MAG: SH3 domain-containing protein [Clostridiales Family XIII bacterium]|jgi:SpoIID/LytB domain protein|nr:SH3 domain-containing protein [Clostridiales Family XIII bacterium]